VILIVNINNELTERQKKFADFYFELNNGTKAAIKAGYAASSAYAEASRQLKNVKVRELPCPASKRAQRGPSEPSSGVCRRSSENAVRFGDGS
jgi:hypothetical protein